jgi:hypothetical protein
MKEWGAKRRCKDDPDQQISLTPTEARQGVTLHVTRYALSWGLGLVTLAFILIYAFQR